ncbi:GNAT family N-acetyltransferase [Streptomyces halstedii]|uniref:GNAT family N-acetyltransferase n=2 Tax=Streptomyces halstedii TaxID=1944 RepID=UPI0036A3B419
MVVLEWGEPGEQLVGDGEAVSGQLFDGGVDVKAVEQDYAVEGQSEGAELVLSELGMLTAWGGGTGRAVGYVLGTADTRRFVTGFREVWIPRFSGRFPEPVGAPGPPTEEMTALLYRPERMILSELDGYPAHLHIDLLPPWQRRGFGRELMDAFLGALRARGVGAVHLSMLTANTPARSFYDRLGFHEIEVADPGPLTYLGRSTQGCGRREVGKY